jgi:tight adherence protein C
MTLTLIIGLVLLGAAGGLVARATALPRLRALQRLSDVAHYGVPHGDLEDAERRTQPRSVTNRAAGALGDLAAARIARIDVDKLRRQLLTAGYYRARPEVFVGYRIVGAAGLALMWIASSGPTAKGMLIAMGLAAAGWFVPAYLLVRRGARRAERIEDALPALVDLLVVTVEAGLSLSGSLQMATRRIKGPLGEELRLALQEQRMGLPVGKALENVLHRCGTPGMRSFVRSITQGETLGVSIGQIMRGLAVEMRERRKARAEERAHKAPVKMLFPLVFLIFPALFVVVLGPGAMRLMESLGSQ